MIILARIKENNNIIGYIAEENKHRSFIDVKDTNMYAPTNVIRLRDGTWRATAGNSIKTIDKKDIQNRNTSLVGKPKLLYNYSFAKLSLTQKILMGKISSTKWVSLDKKEENIKVTMKDISALTSVTGIEYALFERNDNYIIIKGTNRCIHLDNSEIAKLINGGYTWIGHTHPGDSFNCLIPSDGDYDTLRMFNQRQSVIYNSVGQYYVFGKE